MSIFQGGYLTGETLSRLWDHLFVIHMASIFGIPCVMTGHNIGMWNSNFTRKFAKREFSKAKLITTRDKDISINYLAEIGVVGDHIFTTHDDALFCDKTIDISTIRNRCQLSAEEEYMVLSLCDWNKNPEHTVILLDRLKEIINIVLNNSNYIVELLPMAFEDEDICIQLLDACDNDRVRFVKFDDYDFRLIRGIISNSKVCITMRHHPIVFAMGECVPCISLFEDSYFRDKNIGALSLFDMQDYVVCLKDDDYLYEFEKMYKGMDLNAIRNIVSNQLNEMHSRKEEFYRRLKNILN